MENRPALSAARCCRLHERSAIEIRQSSIPCPLYHHLTEQAVGKTPRNDYGNIAAHNRIRTLGRCKVQYLVLRGASGPLLAGIILPFNHHFNNLPEVPLIPAL